MAYIFVPEPTDQPTQKITYGDLYKEVNKFANGLKSLGVRQGRQSHVVHAHDPTTAHSHACHRQDRCYSLHCVLRISSGGLNGRIMDAEAKAVITTDGLYRRGKPIPLKPNVDEATANTPSVQNIIVVKRTGIDVPHEAGERSLLARPGGWKV